MPVLNDFSSVVLLLRFFFDAMLPLPVFCMPAPSDLLWFPSAREHSADPPGKNLHNVPTPLTHPLSHCAPL